MPQAVAAAVMYVGGALGSAAATAGVGAFLFTNAVAIGYATAIGGALAYGNAQKRKARDQFNASLKDREVMIRSAISPRVKIYGRDKVSGPIPHAESTGDKGQYLHLVLKLADYESDEIEEVYFGDVEVLQHWNPSTGFVDGGEFGRLVKHHVVRSGFTSGAGTFTLPFAADKVVSVVQEFGGDGGQQALSFTHTEGSTTVSGLPPGVNVSVDFIWTENKPVVRIRKHLGAPGQVADPDLVAESGGKWTSAHVGVGITYLYVRLEYDQDVFGQTGLPSISAVVRGKKIRDPRSGLTVWSDNAALCVADHLLDGELGLGADPASVPDAEVIEAANICDETVTLDAEGATQKRYATANTINATIAPRDALEQLLADMAGRAVWTQGRWLVRAGAYRTPGDAITVDHLAGSVSIAPKASRSQLFNAVRVTYRDPDQGWAEVQAPLVTNAGYEAEDGGVRIVRDLQMPSAMDALRAQRLGKIELERARQAVTARALCNLRAYDYAPTDVAPLTFARYGWSAKAFEVIERTWSREGTLAYTWRETAAGVYAWNYGEATVGDLAPDTGLPNPYTPPAAIEDLSVASGTDHLLKMADGTIVTRGWVTWTASTSAFVASGGRIEIRWKVAGAADWQPGPPLDGVATGAYIGPLPDGLVILVGVRAVNASGRGGAWTTVPHQVTGKTASPAAVSGLTATAIPGAIRISWTPSTELDHGLTELRRGADWNSGTGILGEAQSTEVAGSTYDWAWPTAGSYTIRARHRDTSGNLSTSEATVSITVTATGIAITASGINASIGGGNLLRNSGFEADSDGDGLADNWTQFSAGTTGTVVPTVDATGGINNSKRQRMAFSGLGTTSADRGGFFQEVDITALGGHPFVASCYFSAGGSVTGELWVHWYSGASLLSQASASFPLAALSVMERHTISLVAPASANKAVFHTLVSANQSGEAIAVTFDNAQLEVGEVPTAYSPRADEILAGAVGTTELGDGAATDISRVYYDGDTAPNAVGITVNPGVNARILCVASGNVKDPDASGETLTAWFDTVSASAPPTNTYSVTGDFGPFTISRYFDYSASSGPVTYYFRKDQTTLFPGSLRFYNLDYRVEVIKR